MEVDSLNTSNFHSGSDCESENGSFEYSFFSSSSSFLSSSFSEGDLWSDTSFSFSSESESKCSINQSSFEPNKQKNSLKSIKNKQLSKSSKEFIKNVEIKGSSLLNAKTNAPESEIEDSETIDPFCNICGEVFTSQEALDVHKLNHLVSENYICEICQHVSKNREDYSLHFRIHDQNSTAFDINSKIKKASTMFPNKCSLCDKTFCFMSSYKRHMDRHNLSHICNICNESFPTKLICHQHKLTHFKKTVHKCEECGKIFQRSHQLTIHMQVHADNEAKFHCKECGTIYCYKTSLTRHILKYHSPSSKKFQCDTCGELFKTKKLLNGHTILHSAKKLISCPDCSQTFKYRSSFHRHRAVHQGLKPFRCNICGQLFETKQLLKSHNAQHVANDEFVCEICDKSFAYQSFLDQHMLTHEVE